MYRSILVSLLLIGAVTAIVTQTGASFVDSGSSTSSNFTAGQVDLQVRWVGDSCPLNTIDGFISYQTPKMVPGDSATQQVTVVNPSSAQVGCIQAFSTLGLRYALKTFIGSEIFSTTAGNPTTIVTTYNHGLSTGDRVMIVNSDATPALSGPYTVTVTATDTFTIPITTSGNGNNVGRVTRYREDLLASQLVLTIKYNKHTACDTAHFNTLPTSTISATNLSNPVTITTGTAHGASTGDTVVITGNTAYNGSWVVTVTDSTHFTIPAAGNGSSGGTVTVQDGIAYQGAIGNTSGKVLWANSPLTNGGDRSIPLGGQDVLCMNIALPASSPDIYQSVGATIVFEFDAQQSANNP